RPPREAFPAPTTAGGAGVETAPSLDVRRHATSGRTGVESAIQARPPAFRGSFWAAYAHKAPRKPAARFFPPVLVDMGPRAPPPFGRGPLFGSAGAGYDSMSEERNLARAATRSTRRPPVRRRP